MIPVTRTPAGYAVIGDPDPCCECGAPTYMTREDALRVARELMLIADLLITDEQDEAIDALVCGLSALCSVPAEPLVIGKFLGAFDQFFDECFGVVRGDEP